MGSRCQLYRFVYVPSPRGLFYPAQASLCTKYSCAPLGRPVDAPMLGSEGPSGLGVRGPGCNGAVGSNGFAKDEVLDAAVTGILSKSVPNLSLLECSLALGLQSDDIRATLPSPGPAFR